MCQNKGRIMQHMSEPMMTGAIAAIYGIAAGFVIGAHLIRFYKSKDWTEISHLTDHALMVAVMTILTGVWVNYGQVAIAAWTVWLAFHMFGKIRGLLR